MLLKQSVEQSPIATTLICVLWRAPMKWMTKFLLDREATINTCSYPEAAALHTATRLDHHTVVNFLLAHTWRIVSGRLSRNIFAITMDNHLADKLISYHLTGDRLSEYPIYWMIVPFTTLYQMLCCCYHKPVAWFNINMSYQYRKSHCGDKTIVRSFYLHNGTSYTGNMTSLYSIRAQGDLEDGCDVCPVVFVAMDLNAMAIEIKCLKKNTFLSSKARIWKISYGDFEHKVTPKYCLSWDDFKTNLTIFKIIAAMHWFSFQCND